MDGVEKRQRITGNDYLDLKEVGLIREPVSRPRQLKEGKSIRGGLKNRPFGGFVPQHFVREKYRSLERTSPEEIIQLSEE